MIANINYHHHKDLVTLMIKASKLGIIIHVIADYDVLDNLLSGHRLVFN